MKPGNELLFLALGGSGEIGMNVNLYGTQGKWVMVDCGVTFGNSRYPGVDLVLPDLRFIEEQLDDLVGIVLTHGHEDHIGALPYLTGDLNVPLYATPFTAGLIRAKMEERPDLQVDLHVVDPGQKFDVGPFRFRYVPLAHSIPEGNALVIETSQGRVFHTGDWKLDEAPLLGTPTTAAELSAIGDDGILALVCDSTNVFNSEASGSEGGVRTALESVVRQATGRVLVTTFASNGARLQTLGEVAQATGRQLCIAGRAIERILRVSQQTGLLSGFPNTIDFATAMQLPAKELLIAATGGQGQSRAALSRIAFGEHKLRLEDGDLVIFSSRQIPGNEPEISKIQNALSSNGVQIITDRQFPVHVSGHPGRPELAKMYDWIKPQLLVPVHGETRHLAEQARFALSKGVKQAIVQQNGEIIRLAPGNPQRVGFAPVGRVVLDGNVLIPAEGATICERRKLATQGSLSIAFAVRDGLLLGKPEFKLSGIPLELDLEKFLPEAERTVENLLSRIGGSPPSMPEIEHAVKTLVEEWTGKSPSINVMMISTD